MRKIGGLMSIPLWTSLWALRWSLAFLNCFCKAVMFSTDLILTRNGCDKDRILTVQEWINCNYSQIISIMPQILLTPTTLQTVQMKYCIRCQCWRTTDKSINQSELSVKPISEIVDYSSQQTPRIHLRNALCSCSEGNFSFEWMVFRARKGRCAKLDPLCRLDS